MQRKLVILMAVVVMVCWAGTASGVTTVFTETLTLGAGNSGLSGCTPPYATVDVTLDTAADTAGFVFTALNN